MWKYLRTVLLFVLSITAMAAPAQDRQVHASPKCIFIIRHAEKPDSRDDVNLTAKGYQRAEALAHVIPDRFGVPDFIWATAATKHSVRPLETIQPLAKALHMMVLHTYTDGEVAKLAADLLSDSRYSGKTILVCWHHGEIPALAKALGVADAPAAWNPEVFDRIWVLRFVDGQVQFQDLPQKALPGDSEK
jgi:hypothetical protein